IPERHRIGVVGPRHHHAVPEDVRDAGRLDAVRARGVPGPRDAFASGDGVHGGVLASVVDTPEEDIPHRDIADWSTAAPAATLGWSHAAASGQRNQGGCYDRCHVSHGTTPFKLSVSTACLRAGAAA